MRVLKNSFSTLLLLFIVFFLIRCTKTNTAKSNEVTSTGFIFHINDTVKNAEDPDEKEIIQLWRDYLTSGTQYTRENEFWHQEGIVFPDMFLQQLYLRRINLQSSRIQNSIIGVLPAKNDYYSIKSMFSSHTDSTDQINLHYITNVYAKKINGQYKLVNATQYYKENLQKYEGENITYYIHSEHNFKIGEAKKMEAFNLKLAQLFELAPIKFDYFSCNEGQDVLKIWGYDFMPLMYQPVQSGGMADIHNQIIYSGNNSSFYPHELVHLYIQKKAPSQAHTFIDEGTATLFGGSTELSLDWHIQKLKSFLEEEPNFDFGEITELHTDIPNGEHITSFKYVIGGFLCKKIFEKEGMTGIFEALKAGRTKENFYQLIQNKLGVSQTELGDYIKLEIRKIPKKDLEKIGPLKFNFFE